MNTVTREKIIIPCDGLSLEGEFSYPDNATGENFAVLVNPHPCLGGDMNNNVILALEEEAHAHNVATLRFNYRGVGESEGQETLEERIAAFWEDRRVDPQSESAIRDCHAAIEKGIHLLGAVPHLFLVGYSFGGVIAMLETSQRSDVNALAMISPPVHQLMGALPKISVPTVVTRGGDDLGVEEDSHRQLIEHLSPQVASHAFEETDHFYRGLEQRLATTVWSAIEVA